MKLEKYLETFPDSPAAKRMLSYVTKGWYDKSYVGKWTYQVMGKEIDAVEQFYLELPYQFFVDTATWGLRYHEQKYGLPVREYLSYEERRALIRLKRDSRYPVTPYRIEVALWERFGAEVHVQDTNDPDGMQFSHPNIFSVRFVQDGNEKGFDLAAARTLIEEMKLSHTVYELFYSHHTWLFQKVQYEPGMSFFMGVEVRSEKNFGFEEALLDGIYFLDGTIRINGYCKYLGVGNGFYDMGFMFSSEVSCVPKLEAVIGHGIGMGPFNVAVLPAGIGFRTAIETNVKANLSELSTGAPVRADTTYSGEIHVGKNLWRLDGEYMIDGTQKLNAEEYVIGL